MSSAESAGRGAAFATLLTLAARFGVSVVLGRTQATLPVEVELACCLVVPLAVGAGLTLLLAPPKHCLAGALTAAPFAYAVADGVIDAQISRALPEMAPMAESFLVGCGAMTGAAIALGVLSLALRVAPTAIERIGPAAAALSCLMSIAAVVWVARAPAAPGLDVWTAFVTHLDETVLAERGFERLDDDPLTFIALNPPPFFDRAWASRVPELPQDRSEIEWRVPSGRALALDRLGLRTSRDWCLLHTGVHVVLLESSRGLLVVRRNDRGVWRACSDEGSDNLGLRVSRARFARYGAPAVCVWMLALGALSGALTLALAWRSHRDASSIERMVVAVVDGEDRHTARLSDGTVVRVASPVPPRFQSVLVEPPLNAPEYRDDARPRVSTWVAAHEGRAPLVEQHRRRVGAHVMLALVITVWLALPAIAAIQHGFVLSFG